MEQIVVDVLGARWKRHGMDIGEVLTVGVITPHAATGPEAELPIMAPRSVRVHVSRTADVAACASTDAKPPRSPAGLRALATTSVLDRAVSAFPPGVKLDLLAFASTSSGYALGYDGASALVGRLEERWGLPACAASLSIVSALRNQRIRRVDLIHPPWFGSSLNELGAAYFASQGFEVIDAQLADIPGDPDRIHPALIVDWVCDHMSAQAEAVVLGGNGFRAAQVIHALEARTGRLIVEANQALLWSALTGTRATPVIRGFGQLLNSRKRK